MLTFASIDSKEVPLVGIKHQDAYYFEEKEIIERATCEYLMALQELQDSIRLKYEPQLAALENPTDIYDYKEEKDMIAKVRKEMNFDEKKYHWNSGLYYH